MPPVESNFSESSRAEALMLHTQPEQRSASRLLVRMPVWLRFYPGDGSEHVGYLRDLSREGLFFYSDVPAQCGATVAFTVKMPDAAGATLVLFCVGTVVRAEQPAPGAAIGVAVHLERCKTMTMEAALPLAHAC